MRSVVTVIVAILLATALPSCDSARWQLRNKHAVRIFAIEDFVRRSTAEYDYHSVKDDSSDTGCHMNDDATTLALTSTTATYKEASTTVVTAAPYHLVSESTTLFLDKGSPKRAVVIEWTIPVGTHQTQKFQNAIDLSAITRVSHTLVCQETDH